VNEGEKGLVVSDIRSRLVAARITGARKWNIADVLGRGGHRVDRATGSNRRNRWRLTETGRRYVLEMLNLPPSAIEIVNTSGALEVLTKRVSDEVVRGFIEEAVLCLKAGALRASVVFLWAGAIRNLQEVASSLHTFPDITSAIQTHDGKARQVSKIADFANVKDSTVLLAFRDLGMLDKGQWQTLEEALGLRNRCGHPTKYEPRSQKVSAFIEDVVGIVFL